MLALRPLLSVLCCLFVWLVLSSHVRAVEVEAHGLFKNAAMLSIDGQRKLLKVGQSLAGVTLVSATSQQAVVDIDGQRHTLTMSRRIGATYHQPSNREVRIPRNQQLQYITNASINGRRVQVMVDTGANIVAINESQATALGIDYARGEPAAVSTASGTARAWQVMLDSVDVGGIRVDHVSASVLEGSHPTIVLLGMTYLRHVKLEEDAGVLVLTRDF